MIEPHHYFLWLSNFLLCSFSSTWTVVPTVASEAQRLLCSTIYLLLLSLTRSLSSSSFVKSAALALGSALSASLSSLFRKTRASTRERRAEEDLGLERLWASWSRPRGSLWSRPCRSKTLVADSIITLLLEKLFPFLECLHQKCLWSGAIPTLSEPISSKISLSIPGVSQPKDMGTFWLNSWLTAWWQHWSSKSTSKELKHTPKKVVKAKVQQLD